MKNPRAMTAAGLLIVVAGGQAARADSAASPASLTLHRGAEVRSIVAGQEQAATASPVTVQRGRRPAAVFAEGISVVLRDPSHGPRAAAGDVVWLVDRDDGRLVACELIETADLGKPKIRCRARALPR